MRVKGSASTARHATTPAGSSVVDQCQPVAHANVQPVAQLAGDDIINHCPAGIVVADRMTGMVKCSIAIASERRLRLPGNATDGSAKKHDGGL
jgi:hypothetical protein